MLKLISFLGKLINVPLEVLMSISRYLYIVKHSNLNDIERTLLTWVLVEQISEHIPYLLVWSLMQTCLILGKIYYS